KPRRWTVWTIAAAAPSPIDDPLISHSMSTASHDRLILLASLLAVTIILVIIAVAFHDRFRPSKRKKHRSQRSSSEQPNPSQNHHGHSHRHHPHRRRRVERPMNPTLAQTGGLPPVREDNPPSPPSRPKTQ
ncbi:MAG TPA: hypothetical protein PKA41_20170, partial [Verrucomicrobiota bacterium]|nr:hypothetical protein [Verrucomicrobiota bacterium]